MADPGFPRGGGDGPKFYYVDPLLITEIRVNLQIWYRGEMLVTQACLKLRKYDPQVWWESNYLFLLFQKWIHSFSRSFRQRSFQTRMHSSRMHTSSLPYSGGGGSQTPISSPGNHHHRSARTAQTVLRKCEQFKNWQLHLGWGRISGCV